MLHSAIAESVPQAALMLQRGNIFGCEMLAAVQDVTTEEARKINAACVRNKIPLPIWNPPLDQAPATTQPESEAQNANNPI